MQVQLRMRVPAGDLTALDALVGKGNRSGVLRSAIHNVVTDPHALQEMLEIKAQLALQAALKTVGGFNEPH